MSTARRFEIVPAGKGAYVFLLALGVGLPLLATAATMFAVPLQDRTLVFIVPMLLIVSLVGFLLLPAMRRLAASIEDRQLVLRATFYTCRIPIAALDLDAARIVDLARAPELRPSLKTNGFAVPGLWAGHFRARPMRQKMFCVLTARDRVLVLPELDGRLLLLSAARPQALLDALRAMA